MPSLPGLAPWGRDRPKAGDRKLIHATVAVSPRSVESLQELTDDHAARSNLAKPFVNPMIPINVTPAGMILRGWANPLGEDLYEAIDAATRSFDENSRYPRAP